jgi:hypothetical protein
VYLAEVSRAAHWEELRHQATVRRRESMRTRSENTTKATGDSAAKARDSPFLALRAVSAAISLCLSPVTYLMTQDQPARVHLNRLEMGLPRRNTQDANFGQDKVHGPKGSARVAQAH